MPLLLAAPPAYDPAPWYVQWLWEVLTALPAGLSLLLLVLLVMGYLLRDKLKTSAEYVFDMLTDRLKRSSKEPISAKELGRKATKTIVLEQTAERLRLEIDCDHVSVYGCQNGEYLRSGDGIDKFVMQAEASRPGDPRYIDVERIVFASDIPRTVLALESQAYLLLWRNRCDDWKVDKMMTERDYKSSVAVFLRRPVKKPGGGMEEGIIGMYVLSWRRTELYRSDQTGFKHPENKRLIDEEFQQMLADYARELSYTM